MPMPLAWQNMNRQPPPDAYTWNVNKNQILIMKVKGLLIKSLKQKSWVENENIFRPTFFVRLLRSG